MDTQSITQEILTQQSQRSRQKVDKIIAEFIGYSRSVIETGQPSEEVTIFINNYYPQLSIESRRTKLFSFVTRKGTTDSFIEFFTAWFHLLQFTSIEKEEHRLAAIEAIIISFESRTFSLHDFVPLSNLLSDELSKVTTESLIKLTTVIGERVKSEERFISRWRDGVLLIVQRVVVEQKTKKTIDSHFTEEFLTKLLRLSMNPDIYSYVLSIINDLKLTNISDEYFTNDLVNELSEKGKRVEASWKTFFYLKGIVKNESKQDAKLEKILLTLNTSWNCEGELSEDIFLIISHFKTVVEEQPLIGSSIFSLFKHHPGVILTSQFGFIALIALCGIERFRIQSVQEMKKVLGKIWKFEEECEQHGWLKTAGLNLIGNSVRQQICLITKYLTTMDRTKDENNWTILGNPLLYLGFAILENSSVKTLTIVDGQIVEDGSIWFFAKKILTETILGNTTIIPSQLEPIVHSIASTGNSGSALIFIDILVDIVRKCAVDVLNNSKLLEGLFDYICRMKKDVGISLVRCLLPIINQRAKLRQSLFRTLKNSMLNDQSAQLAIPIMVLLLRSVSHKKCLKTDSFSQSFASFSTQSLTAMGIRPSADDGVGLEVIGMLKKCLTQPATSKIVLYESLIDSAQRCPSLLAPCLDLLCDHAGTIQTWTSESMVSTSKNLIQLKEPLPHLAQAIESLAFGLISKEEPSAMEDSLVQTATSILDKWVEKAVTDDVHDLGIDKISEWNPSTPAGGSNLIFARMMLSFYDVLIEHVWRQFDTLKREEDRDSLNGLLNRKQAVEEVLAEKTVRRKEAKVGATEGSSIDLNLTETATSAQIIAAILERLIPVNALTSEVEEIRELLLDWALDRAVKLSTTISQSSNSLHSTFVSSKHLSSIASNLFEFFKGIDCVDWISEMAGGCSSKTKALKAYYHICRYFCTKYKKDLPKITSLWKINDSQSQLKGTTTIVQHIHFLTTLLYPSLLTLEKDKINKKQEFEQQGRYVIQIAWMLLEVTANPKAANSIFKHLSKTAAENYFASIAMLKDFLKYLEFVGLRCSDYNLVSKEMSSLADEIIQLLSDDTDKIRYVCISNDTYPVVVEFLIHMTEERMASIRNSLFHTAEFYPKHRVDEILSKMIEKIDESSDTISHVLPLHNQFHVQQERLVLLLTAFFSTIESVVTILLNDQKSIPALSSWQSVTDLAALLQNKVQAIMAIADENVGLIRSKDDHENAKRRQKKAKKDEGIYVKYVKAREVLQSIVLRLSKSLKDDRLNLQIKNNTIGIRDFRLNMRVLEERISASSDEPIMKRRRRQPAEGEENNDTTIAGRSTVY